MAYMHAYRHTYMYRSDITTTFIEIFPKICNNFGDIHQFANAV